MRQVAEEEEEQQEERKAELGWSEAPVVLQRLEAWLQKPEKAIKKAKKQKNKNRCKKSKIKPNLIKLNIF